MLTYFTKSVVSIVILTLLFSSCSIEKRQHLKGYHIDFKSRTHQTEGIADQEIFDRTAKQGQIEESRRLITSSDDDLTSLVSKPNRMQIIAQTAVSADDSVKCDRITLRSGEEIAAKVIEVGNAQIKYKKCTNQDGPAYTIDKSDVFMIVYSNGDRDVFEAEQKATASPAPTATSSPANDDDDFDTNIYSLASLIAGIVSILGFLFFPLFAALLGLFAVIVGAMVLAKLSKRENKEGRGLAIAGLVIGSFGFLLGIGFFLFILLFLLA